MFASIIQFFSKAIKSPDIRRKLIISAGILVIYRLIAHIPAAGLSLGMYTLLRSQGIISGLSLISLLALAATMTAGAILSVWLGELITEYGISNGISFLIFSGIVARLPVTFGQSVAIITTEDILKIGLFIGLSVAIVALIVFMNEATRQIPVSYARRVGRAGLSSSYIPLRLNQAGVIPIIFAVSLVLLPSLLSQFLTG